MKRVLVTAFKPFDQRPTNQSLEVMKKLIHVDKLSLDVLFEKAFETLKHHLKLNEYDYIICLGEAPYKNIYLEHVALNIMHARIPDNDSFKPLNEPVRAHSPLALSTSLPLTDISRYLKEKGHIHTHSYHAGTYVCNDLFYRLMHFNLSTPRGFIHVPHDKTYFENTLASIQAIIDSLI